VKTSKFAIEPIEIGFPRFLDGSCIAPVLFRYENVTYSRRETVSNLGYQLVLRATVSIDDDGKPMVGSVTCWTNQGKVDAEKKVLTELQKSEYVNYLRALTAINRRNAISELAAAIWGTDNPTLLDHPQLVAALIQLGIADLSNGNLPDVGPVEFQVDHCTAPIIYTLYSYPSSPNTARSSALSTSFEEMPEAQYCVKVHILARISDRVATGTGDAGGQLVIEDLWFSIEPSP
jgi:hypothetical protein